MQVAFMAILTVALLATVVSFLVMAVRQSRWSRRLERYCLHRGLHFDRDDPFAIPMTGAKLALMSSGHSPRARNVAHGCLSCDGPADDVAAETEEARGPVEGHPHACEIRAFEFSYEVAHGPRRMTCWHSVVSLVLEADAGEVLMWHDADADFAPMDVRQIDGHIGSWSFVGDAATAECLAGVDGDLREIDLSVQYCDGVLAVSGLWRDGRRRDYTEWFDVAVRAAERLEARASGPSSAALP